LNVCYIISQLVYSIHIIAVLVYALLLWALRKWIIPVDFGVGCFLADAITSYHYIKKLRRYMLLIKKI